MLFEEAIGAVLGVPGGGPVEFHRGLAVLCVVGFDVVEAVLDALALLLGAGLLLEFGRLVGEVGDLAVGEGFGVAELVDAVGEFGAAGTGEASQLFEFVLCVGALLRGVARAFTGVSPLGFELVDVVHHVGEVLESCALVVESSDVVALSGFGSEPELFGLSDGGFVLAGQAIGGQLDLGDAGPQRDVDEAAMGSSAPALRDSSALMVGDWGTTFGPRGALPSGVGWTCPRWVSGAVAAIAACSVAWSAAAWIARPNAKITVPDGLGTWGAVSATGSRPRRTAWTSWPCWWAVSIRSARCGKRAR